MKSRAVPLLAVGIAGLFLASAVAAVVVSGQDDQVATVPSTSTSFPPFEDTTTTSVVPNTLPTPVQEVPPPPVSVAPVPDAAAGGSTTTATTVAPAPSAVLAVDPAPCQPPVAQPAAGTPAGPVGVFTAATGEASVRLVSAAARLPAWRPKSGHVITVAVGQGKPWGLCLSGPDGSSMRRLTTPAGVGRPALSFDGSRFAARSARPGGVDLVVGSIDGADLKVLLQSGEIGDPVWLGDGSGVVTCAVTGGARRLVSVPAAGGEPKVLRNACPTSPVASSPDGRLVSFAFPDQVVVLDVRTGATTNLKTATVSTATAPSWSPNGRRVAFAYIDPRGPALGVMDLDAKQGFTVLAAPGLGNPNWGPTDLVVFTATDGNTQGVFVVKADGTGRRPLATCQARCTIPPQPWSPDGSRVAFEVGAAA